MISNRVKGRLIAACFLAGSAHGIFAASGCKEALAQYSVCEAANVFANNLISARHLEAVSVVQEVSTGALVLFAASQPVGGLGGGNAAEISAELARFLAGNSHEGRESAPRHHGSSQEHESEFPL